jgi:uncharacterized protein (TIGR02246 family)
MYRTLAEIIEGIEQGILQSSRPEDRKLASDYLAALPPLLAGAVLGKDILRQLPVIDRLFGYTWLIDEAPFHEALSKWKVFREEYEKFALSGMTVNERLYALGTLRNSIPHAPRVTSRRSGDCLPQPVWTSPLFSKSSNDSREKKMNIHDENVVSGIIAQLEKAWNAADGAGFAKPFAEDADFVNIRGDHMRTREIIGRGHQGIFDTIYKGSVVRYQVAAVREVAPTVLVAHVKSKLNAPTGPLVGEHSSLFTLVLVQQKNEWQIAAFHNTLVA